MDFEPFKFYGKMPDEWAEKLDIHRNTATKRALDFRCSPTGEGAQNVTHKDIRGWIDFLKGIHLYDHGSVV